MAAPVPQRIQVEVKDIRYDLEGPLAAVISTLQKMQTEYTRQGFEELSIDVDVEDDYGDSHYARARLFGFRMETNEEALLREGKAAQMKAFMEKREREQLEALRKKYG